MKNCLSIGRYFAALAAVLLLVPRTLLADDGLWEITPESQAALDRGIEWLAKNQGPEGNWEDGHLGLVSMGALAFLAAGHLPDRGKYGAEVRKSIDYVVKNAKPSGLLNIANRQNDMYNHGLSTFMLGQAYGMTGDREVGRVLDRALRLIEDSQCGDGGWDYNAVPKPETHDLSLCVMQAKALRSAMDSGLKVDPKVVEKAVQSVRRYYIPDSELNPAETAQQWAARGGRFSYRPGDRGRISLAMTACGIVCLQEFGEYDDWRIPGAMKYVRDQVVRGEDELKKLMKDTYKTHATNHVPFDSYTLYYVGQALYQVGGDDWKTCYPILRDELVRRQLKALGKPEKDGSWTNNTWWMTGKEADLYGTAIGCFFLAIPNRYLPILQDGPIETLKKS
jgi:hypothetical protein